MGGLNASNVELNFESFNLNSESFMMNFESFMMNFESFMMNFQFQGDSPQAEGAAFRNRRHQRDCGKGQHTASFVITNVASAARLCENPHRS